MGRKQELIKAYIEPLQQKIVEQEQTIQTQQQSLATQKKEVDNTPTLIAQATEATLAAVQTVIQSTVTSQNDARAAQGQAFTTALNNGLNSKLGKQDDMATNLKISTENTADNSAVRMSQLKGGLRRPYFVFKNLAATLQQAPDVIKNPFPEALAYQPTDITCYVINRPGLAATVTVSYLPAGGGAAVVIYTRPVALLDIPVVGGVFDLVSPKTVLPEVPVGARLQAVATAGTFKVIIDGLLQ